MQRAGRKVVFLGPSLGHSEARDICPDAELHPPVRFGDLYALASETPGQVLIVDGVFHDSTPVWQREILQLLRLGWLVLGASSMGALRALELEAYGMVGIGTVFEWYRSGRIEGDDEVALLHGVAEMDYQPLTLPLVDVRHVLMGLEAQGVLALPQVSGILAEFKRMGHEIRTRSALLALVRAHHGEVAVVRDRLSDRGRSLKAHDARLALRVMAGQLPLPATGKRWPEPTPLPMHPQATLQRRMYPLAGGPPVRMVEALRSMAQRPDALARPVRESRRRWFLYDWVCITGKGTERGRTKRPLLFGTRSDWPGRWASRCLDGAPHRLCTRTSCRSGWEVSSSRRGSPARAHRSSESTIRCTGTSRHWSPWCWWTGCAITGLWCRPNTVPAPAIWPHGWYGWGPCTSAQRIFTTRLHWR